MRKTNLLPILVSLAVLAACAEQPTSPPITPDGAAHSADVVLPAQTAFEGLIHFCDSFGGETRITPGEILILQGARNRNLWITGNPLVDGPVENVVSAVIHLGNGKGVVHLELTLTPDAVDGAWIMTQQIQIEGGRPARGEGVGHGTGELQGRTIKFTTAPASGPSVCNPNMGTASVQGIIISSADPE